MTKKERADHIVQYLEKLYPKTPVPLNHKDVYTLLVAVLLSAQCTDIRVNQVTPHLFKLADNPVDMAKKRVETIPESRKREVHGPTPCVKPETARPQAPLAPFQRLQSGPV